MGDDAVGVVWAVVGLPVEVLPVEALPPPGVRIPDRLDAMAAESVDERPARPGKRDSKSSPVGD